MSSLIPKTARRVAACRADVLRTAPACRFPRRRLAGCSRAFHVSPPRPRPAQGLELNASEKETVARSRDTSLQKENVVPSRFADFDLGGKVFVVTGGAQGLGLALAESLVEGGARVYAVDRAPAPNKEWHKGLERVRPEWGGSLEYRQQDVTDTEGLEQLMVSIGDENGRFDGLVAAAAIQQVTPASRYEEHDVQRMMSVNYTGVMMACTAAERQMSRFKIPGSIVIIASMSGLVANKGLKSAVYNSSKAAVLQLARNLAMEYSPKRPDGGGGVRVNCISPGHIMTPMVEKNLEEAPGLREEWERENMMGRLSLTSEYKGAVLFLASSASSFMTGGNLVIDGGHTAW